MRIPIALTPAAYFPRSTKKSKLFALERNSISNVPGKDFRIKQVSIFLYSAERAEETPAEQEPGPSQDDMTGDELLLWCQEVTQGEERRTQLSLN